MVHCRALFNRPPKPFCAIILVLFQIYQFWFIGPFLAEMQSIEQETGVLFLPI